MLDSRIVLARVGVLLLLLDVSACPVSFAVDYLWFVDDSSVNTGIYKCDTNGVLLQTLSTTLNGIEDIAFGGGYLWALQQQTFSPLVYKINPATGATVSSFALTGLSVLGRMCYSGGYLWIVQSVSANPTLYKVNTATGAVVSSAVLGSVYLPHGIGYGSGHLWILQNDSFYPDIYKIDPQSGGLISTLHMALTATVDIDFGNGYIWAAQGSQPAPEGYRIDPIAGTILAVLNLGVTWPPGGMAYADNGPPGGTVTIDAGAAYTNNVTVTLTLSASDGTGSGVSEMQFSNNNVTWNGWELYGTSKAWSLSGGDGAKTVYVQYRDAAGNVSTGTISDGITLDTTRPTPVISGSTALTNASRTLTINFGEVVNGFALGKVSASSGTPSNLLPSGAASSYTVDVMGSGTATVSVSVAGSVVTDSAGNPNNPTGAPFTYPFDNVAPTPVITGATTLTNALRTLTVNFGETVQGFGLGNISIANGTPGNLQPAGAAASYTVDVMGSGTATVSVSLAGSAVMDAANNPNNPTTAPFTYPFDNVAPTPVITGASALTNASRTLTIAFGENMNGFSLPTGVSVANGTASNLQATANPGEYTVDILGLGTNEVSVSIPASVATDDASNPNNPTAVPFTYPFDNVAPTPVITGASTLTKASRTLTVAFSETVNAFSLPSGVSVTNGVVSNLQATGTPGIYTVDVLGSGTNTVSVSIPEGVATDNATNPNNATAEPFTFPFDDVRPAPVITGAATPTNAARTLTIDFGEEVNGFALDMVSVSNGTASNLQPAGAASSYTVDILGSGTATVSVSIAGSVVTDDATNPNNPTAQPFTYLFDNVAPTPVITGSDTLTNTTRTLTIAFGEHMNGFSLPGGVNVSNGTASNLQPTANPGEYTVDIMGAGTNTVSVTIPAGVATDDATNPNNATAEPFSFPFDDVRPTPIISGAATPTNAARTLTIDFGEKVNGFALDMVSVSNGTASNLQPAGAASSYTVDVLGSGTATVSVSIAGSLVTDDATNPNNATAEPFTFLFDDVRPTPVISGATILTNATRTLTIDFGENVNGFALDMVSVSNGTAGNLQPAGVASSYTVDVLGSGTAAVSISVAGSVVTDDATNPNNPTSQPFTYLFDNVAQTPVITGSDTLTNTTRTLAIAFGEHMNGFSLPGGVNVSNGTASNLQPTANPGEYTVDVLGAGTNTVSVTIPAGVAADDATNPSNPSAGAFTFPFDGVAPTASITLDDPTPTGADVVHFGVDFSESVGTSFADADVAVTGTLPGTPIVTGTDPNYTVTVTLADPDADGTVGIDIGTTVTDRAGNPYAGGSASTYTIANEAPVPVAGLIGLGALLGLIAIASTRTMRKK